MSKLRIRMHLEVEGEDVSEKMLQDAELQWALIRERLEATLICNVQALHPGLSISCEEKEDE